MAKTIIHQTKKQRVLDLQALLGRHKRDISLKDVCESAGIESYNSVKNALGQVVNHSNEGAISEDRLTLLEETLISLTETKLQPSTN